MFIFLHQTRVYKMNDSDLKVIVEILKLLLTALLLIQIKSIITHNIDIYHNGLLEHLVLNKWLI